MNVSRSDIVRKASGLCSDLYLVDRDEVGAKSPKELAIIAV